MHPKPDGTRTPSVPTRAPHMRRTDALPFRRRIEVGPWFEVGEAVDGATVLTHLERRYGGGAAPPYCVYVHVPFCASRCSYCALYTSAVRVDAHTTFDEFVDHALRSVREHPVTRAGRAPTTVHFGGGTPLHIGVERVARLVGEIRVRFGDSAECEWALETTTSSIEPGTPSTLRDVGFGRIHLGIQTLDDGVRRRIRRRESGRAALAKIAALQRAGFLVSVDLIIGFKGVTDAVVREDLRLLFDAGIRTFSICELRTLLSARSGTEPAARAAESNFRTWSLIWRFMERHGLIPIHVGQFATRSQDNLYYTHPARGEDCVAIGPYAHGSTGPLYYGNLLLPEYYEALQRGSAPVASGVLYDDAAQLIRALERDLLGHRLPRDTVRAVSSTYGPSFQRLLATWIEQRLLLAGPAEEPYRLTMQGSWFVGNMVGQARRLVSAGRPGPRQFRNVRQQVFASTGGGE